MPKRRPQKHDAGRIRYVTSRLNAEGSVRWYWRRPGHPLQRLPDNPEARAYEAIRLNAEADRPKDKIDGGFPEGTIGWLIALYKKNARPIGNAKLYTELSNNTRSNYDRFLNDLSSRLGKFSITGFTRVVVVQYFESIPRGSQGAAASVLFNLGALAHNSGRLPANPARELGVSKGPARSELWSSADLQTFFQACRVHREGTAVWDAIMLGLFTGQRVGDVLKLGISNIKNGKWNFIQSKTRKELSFPVHKALEPLISEALAVGREHVISSSTGRPVAKSTLESWFREIRDATPLHNLQFRDLRRTAATTLKELKLDDDNIIAITGHTRESFRKAMADVYIVKTERIARETVDRWESSHPAAILRVTRNSVSSPVRAIALAASEETE